MSKVCAPTLSLSRVRKELPALMAILCVLSRRYAAFYDNRNPIGAPSSYTGRAVNIVLISTYELGRQPFGLASPAAWLRARGHKVTCLDLSREALDEAAIRTASVIAFYVPMHTATRLAAGLIAPVRGMNPHVHICFYGLYAPVNEAYLRKLGVGTILGGEFEEGLASLAARLGDSSKDSLNVSFRGAKRRGISPFP